MSSKGMRRSQSGIVLVVALIMLLMVTLIASVSSNLVQTNLKVVQNIEARAAVRNAARSALQEAIAYGKFTDTINGTPFVSACGSANIKCFDINGDGVVDDIKVTLTDITCLAARLIKNDELDAVNSPQEASCYQTQDVYSLCADAVWQVTATAVDEVTGAQVVITQGVSTRTTRNQISVACS